MINYEIYPEEELITVSATGALTVDSLLSAATKLRADSRYDHKFKGVCDFRSAETSVDLSEVRQLVARLAMMPGDPLSMWALLVNKPRTTGLATIYEQLGKHLHQAKAFSTVEAAGEWLDKDLSAYLPVSG